jgi:hypothetical protein
MASYYFESHDDVFKIVIMHISHSVFFLNIFISESLLEDFGDIILLYLINLRGEETSYPRNMEQDVLDR